MTAYTRLGTSPLGRRMMEITARVVRSISLRMPGSAQRRDADGEAPFVLRRGQRLPPRSMRALMCGDAFVDDGFYFMSAVLEALKFTQRLDRADARVVDIGSGLGRLATGLIAVKAKVHYVGIDANEPFVRWCGEHIQALHPDYRFLHLDMANDRYNPDGTLDGSDLRLPVDDACADVVNLWGVFTNMVPGHVEAFVREIGRILRPDGQCFLTAFAEDGVPDVTINPQDYVPYACEGPLTAVRYGKDWLFATFRRHGLEVQEFRHHGSMFPKQSEIYLSRAGAQAR